MKAETNFDIKAEALDVWKQLVLESGYQKATIKAVITKLGISRTSFYNHFPDKYGLVDAYIESISHEFYEEPINMESALRNGILFANRIADDRSFFMKLYYSDARDQLQNDCSKVAEMIVSACLKELLFSKNEYCEEAKKQIARYCQLTFRGHLGSWIMQSCWGVGNASDNSVRQLIEMELSIGKYYYELHQSICNEDDNGDDNGE